MHGTVLLERKTGWELGELGTRTDVWEPVYEGRGLVSLPQQTASEVDSAGLPRTLATYVGRVPVGVAPLVGDRLTVTASDDPGMIGLRFVVEFVEAQDFAADRTMRLVRVVIP